MEDVSRNSTGACSPSMFKDVRSREASPIHFKFAQTSAEILNDDRPGQCAALAANSMPK